MGTRRKSEPPANSFWVAQEGMRPRFIDSTGVIFEEATAAYYKLIELLFPAVETRTLTQHARSKVNNLIPDFGVFYPRGIFATLHVGTPEQQKALNDLFLSVQQAIESAHDTGTNRGKSLLIQLAKGALTCKEFNDCAIKGEA